MRIILASQSPRRRELLERVGIKDFAVAAPNVDESVEPGLAPAEMVERLSLRKAGAAAEKAEPEALIIAADTVVALDGAVLGKPGDEEEAFAMLSALSGREHHVYTGLTVWQGERRVTQHEETAVVFRTLGPEEIRGLRHPGRGRAAGAGHPRGLLQCDGPAGVPAGAHSDGIWRGPSAK